MTLNNPWRQRGGRKDLGPVAEGKFIMSNCVAARFHALGVTPLFEEANSVAYRIRGFIATAFYPQNGSDADYVESRSTGSVQAGPGYAAASSES